MQNDQFQPPDPATSPPMGESQPAPKKRWLGLAIAAIAVLITAIGGMVWWTSTQQKQFAAAAGAYERRVETTFEAISGQPEDTAAYITFLQKHEAALGASLKTEPQPPKLLWITAAPKASAQRVEQLSKAARDLQTAMQNYRKFLVYRDGVLEAVRGSGGTISTVDELRETASRLEAAQKTIQNLQPPPGLEDHQQKQAALYNRPIQTIQTALTAYDKGNPTLYADKVAQLAEDVQAISLPKTVDELMGIHQYYEAMTNAYNALEKLLK